MCANDNDDASPCVLPRVVLQRFYEEGRFVIRATQDIASGEELLHVYKSKKWRECFNDMPGNSDEK